MADENPIAPAWLVPALLTLTTATGLNDAVSFLRLGHVFVANMTGNVVFIGFSVDPHSGVSAIASVVALGGFVAGVAIAARLHRLLGARPRRWLAIALGGEAASLAVIAVLVALGVLPLTGGLHLLTIAVLAVCFGLQNATARRLSVRDLTTTVLTSTLTSLVTDGILGGGTGEHRTRRLGALVGMAAGAAAGALLVTVSAALVIGLAALLVGGVATALAAAPITAPAS